MRHLDLFSGIGGFALAAQWMGWQTVAFCEREKYARRVLEQHWPSVPIIDDITQWPSERIGCDIITGGFPCQPFSCAGKQAGKQDDRFLWPAMLSVVEQERPAWVVGENVFGIIKMALDQVLSDLEAIGYATRAFVIPACAVDAPHRRDRVWIIANSNTNGSGSNKKRTAHGSPEAEFEDIPKIDREAHTDDSKQVCGFLADSQSERIQGLWAGGQQVAPAHEGQKVSLCQSKGPQQTEWPTESRVCRVVDGLPNRVDRVRSLGNAIVPQVAYKLFQAIEKFPD